MLAADAADIIDSCTFMPGWRFETAPAFRDPYFRIGYRDDALRLLIEWQAPNFDERYAPHYPVNTTPGRVFVLELDGKDEKAVLREVLDLCVRCLTHEAREAFRLPDSTYGERWVAPFHPHRPEGQRAYGDAVGDIAFENAV